uniref:Uncharacterized protein n=1 Tax=Arundo donax TaxID=35708 RepID=A0A0A9GNG6_ARUDO
MSDKEHTGISTDCKTNHASSETACIMYKVIQRFLHGLQNFWSSTVPLGFYFLADVSLCFC